MVCVKTLKDPQNASMSGGNMLRWGQWECTGRDVWKEISKTLDLGGEREARSKKSLRLLNPSAGRQGVPVTAMGEVRESSWLGEKDSKCRGRQLCVQTELEGHSGEVASRLREMWAWDLGKCSAWGESTHGKSGNIEFYPINTKIDFNCIL